MTPMQAKRNNIVVSDLSLASLLIVQILLTLSTATTSQVGL